MIWVDVVILVVIALSAVIGFFRGLVREAIGLMTWLVAFYLAFIWAESAAILLEDWISIDSARLAVAFGIIFIAVLFVGALINYGLSRLLSQTGFAGTDRVLGGVFGVLRGAAVLVLLTMLAGVTPVPRDDWWQNSVLIPHLEDGAVWLRDYLPADLANAITYPDVPDTSGSTPSTDTSST